MKLFKLLLISLPAIFLLNPVFAADELPISGYNASRDYPGAHLTRIPNTRCYSTWSFLMRIWMTPIPCCR